MQATSGISDTSNQTVDLYKEGKHACIEIDVEVDMYSVFTAKPVVFYGLTPRCKIFTPSPTSYTKSKS